MGGTLFLAADERRRSRGNPAEGPRALADAGAAPALPHLTPLGAVPDAGPGLPGMWGPS
jgi:hypothetical protein